MKRRYICVLLFCFLSLTTVGATKSSEPLSFEGWIDADQEDGQANVLHLSTDFKLDASAIREDVLKTIMSEKVSVQGVFVKDTQGALVFKIQTLKSVPTTQESDDNVLESSESDLMEEGH